MGGQAPKVGRRRSDCMVRPMRVRRDTGATSVPIGWDFGVSRMLAICERPALALRAQNSAFGSDPMDGGRTGELNGCVQAPTVQGTLNQLGNVLSQLAVHALRDAHEPHVLSQPSRFPSPLPCGFKYPPQAAACLPKWPLQKLGTGVLGSAQHHAYPRAASFDP